MASKGVFTANVGPERVKKLRDVSKAAGQSMTGFVEAIIESSAKQLEQLKSGSDGKMPEVEIITRLRVKKADAPTTDGKEKAPDVHTI